MRLAAVLSPVEMRTIAAPRSQEGQKYPNLVAPTQIRTLMGVSGAQQANFAGVNTCRESRLTARACSLLLIR